MTEARSIAWVLRLGLRGATQTALLALLVEADGGLVCRPTIAALAERAQLSAQGLINGIRKLQAMGVVRVVFGGLQGTVNTYHILAPAEVLGEGGDNEPPAQIAPPPYREGDKEDSKEHVALSVSNDLPAYTPPKKEGGYTVGRGKEPKNTPSSPFPPDAPLSPSSPPTPPLTTPFPPLPPNLSPSSKNSARDAEKTEADQPALLEIDPPALGKITKAAKPQPDRGTRLDPDWTPGQEGARFARELGLDPKWTFDGFRDYWLSKPGADGRKVDWFRTWCNWCRNNASRQSRGGPPQAQVQRRDPISGRPISNMTGFV